MHDAGVTGVVRLSLCFALSSDPHASPKSKRLVQQQKPTFFVVGVLWFSAWRKANAR